MKTRIALAGDFDDIFIMGFDVWSDGLSNEEYLKACHESPKYKSGTFLVLEDQGLLLASLIFYSLNDSTYGIGSIAVPSIERNKGYGTKIIRDALSYLESKKHDPTIYLYSDIDPEFYERFGFISLPADLQKYEFTTCMVRAKSNMIFSQSDLSKIPNYF